MNSRPQLTLALRAFTVIIFLLPLLWMISAALHPPGVPLPQTLQFLPDGFSFGNFKRIWEIVPVGRFLFNSLFIVVIAVPITVLIASWTGFSMAQLPKGSQRFWIIVCLAILMIPGIALWSTRFLVFKWLGWLNTPLALIAPAFMGTSPFYVLMFYRSFRRIPTAVYDAARLDGAGVWQAWAQVTFPIVRPTAVGVALLSFTFYWGDFISPLLYLRSESQYTLPIALQLLQQLSRSDWPLLMAAATFATIIPISLFLLLQPYFNRPDS